MTARDVLIRPYFSFLYAKDYKYIFQPTLTSIVSASGIIAESFPMKITKLISFFSSF